ncbi:MAG: hypothetical protein U0821_03715 [Chloroflexota bacterium]
MMPRRYDVDELLAFVDEQKRRYGHLIPRVKRTLPRNAEKSRILVDLAVAQMLKALPETFEVLGPRQWRLKP